MVVSQINENDLRLNALKTSLYSKVLEQKEKLGVTNKELADSIGMTESNLIKYLNGYYEPTLDYLYKLSVHLKLEFNLTLR